MAKTERIFDMLQIIRENPGMYNARDLAKLCDVSERGIFRYKVSLAKAGVIVRSGYERKLFSIGLEYRTDLDNGSIGRLRQAFVKNGISLSHNPAVLKSTEEGGGWQIVDNSQAYVVKERAGGLTICKQGGYELLGPYWKKVLKEIDPKEREAIGALVEAGMETCTDDQVLKHGEKFLKFLDGR